MNKKKFRHKLLHNLNLSPTEEEYVGSREQELWDALSAGPLAQIVYLELMWHDEENELPDS